MPDPIDLKRQLYLLEESLLRPEVGQSALDLDELLAGDFRELGSFGAICSKARVLAELPRAPPVEASIADFDSRVLAPGVALVTYKVTRFDDRSAGGSSSLRSSLWRFEDGRWRMVFHQGRR